MAFQQLEADEQAQLRERLLSLVTTPATQWPAALARRLPGDQPLYLVRVNDSMRVFIQVVEGSNPKSWTSSRRRRSTSWRRVPPRMALERGWVMPDFQPHVFDQAACRQQVQ